MGKPGFEAVFGPYIAQGGWRAAFADAEVESIDLNKSGRWMKAEIRFPRFVNHETVFAAEGALAAALSLRHAEILPRYPGESLCETCFPSLVEFLRRRSAAVNGTFDGAACRLAGERLTVSLSHGGLNILRTTKTDDLLRRMIREMFGRPIELHIEGAEETDTASEHYKAMMEQAERDAAAARQEAATPGGGFARADSGPRALRPPLRARRRRSRSRANRSIPPARRWGGCPSISRRHRWCSARPSGNAPPR